ncbi:MAG: TIGR03087 family PEP-CTERM/XrtA system glycosyltransferase [Sphingobium sp.]
MAGEILFLCHRIPFPPDRGDKIRSYNLLKALARLGPVHVGTFADDDRDMGFAGNLADVAASQCVVPRRSRVRGAITGLLKHQPMLVALYENARLRQWVQQTLADRPISAVVAYSVQMAQFVPPLGRDVRFIMDFVDFDSAKYEAYGAKQRGPMGWVNRREGIKLFAYEQAVAARADENLFVSHAEADLFCRSAHIPACRARGVDNGVNLAYFHPDADFAPLSADERWQGPLIVFTGQMDYRPNIEAVESFARASLPSIRVVHPDARFAIVGRNPSGRVRALANLPGVVVTGGVPDVRGWVAAADVVVAPLRTARGVQNKVLEAMAMGRPVVVSPQAAEGIDAQDGEHFSVAADSGSEIATVLGLLDDKARAAAMGHAARRQMETRYDWAATLAPIAHMLGERPKLPAATPA